MRLYLNTSNNLKTIIKLNNKQFIKTYDSPRDQDLIGALTQALNTQNQTIKNLTSIQVFTGPGSFTGLRVGISVANALSFALQIPVNKQNPGTTITPNYGKPPSITISPKNQA